MKSQQDRWPSFSFFISILTLHLLIIGFFCVILTAEQTADFYWNSRIVKQHYVPPLARWLGLCVARDQSERNIQQHKAENIKTKLKRTNFVHISAFRLQGELVSSLRLWERLQSGVVAPVCIHSGFIKTKKPKTLTSVMKQSYSH